MSLKGKIAVVTGAASGIGRACALHLAQDGAAVAVWDLNEDGARETAALIEQAGGRGLAQRVDAASSSEIAQALTHVHDALGPVAILVNNAGITAFKSFLEITEAEWDRMLSINTKGPALVTRAIIPDMIAAQWGRIVNISSSSAQSGAVAMTHYSASKGGVIAFTKSLALEFAKDGITVNNIPPGFIDTPMLRSSPIGPVIDATSNSSPMGRPGKPEDIAATCAFLCSEAANYITAQTIGVNGGRNPT